MACLVMSSGYFWQKTSVAKPLETEFNLVHESQLGKADALKLTASAGGQVPHQFS